jgi:hypothetical protein
VGDGVAAGIRLGDSERNTGENAGVNTGRDAPRAVCDEEERHVPHPDEPGRRVAPAGRSQSRPPCAEAVVDRPPALGGVADLDALLESRRDDKAAPAVLRALAVLAPGDDLAARTLLQALLPGLVRLAGLVGYDDRAAIEEMVSLAWERIRTYPARRRGSVAANVLFDVST